MPRRNTRFGSPYNFALAGATIFSLSVIAAGLLLCTDYLLLNLWDMEHQWAGRPAIGRILRDQL